MCIRDSINSIVYYEIFNSTTFVISMIIYSNTAYTEVADGEVLRKKQRGKIKMLLQNLSFWNVIDTRNTKKVRKKDYKTCLQPGNGR